MKTLLFVVIFLTMLIALGLVISSHTTIQGTVTEVKEYQGISHASFGQSGGTREVITIYIPEQRFPDGTSVGTFHAYDIACSYFHKGDNITMAHYFWFAFGWSIWTNIVPDNLPVGCRG